MMKRMMLLSGLWASLLLVGSPGFGANEVKDQRPWRVTSQNPPVVTLDLNPSEPMTFSAAELRRYLGQILGVKLPNVPSSDDAPTIHLAVKHDANLTDEGYELHADGSTYHITGGDDAGLVYGAYEFLRRYGGCRFSDMGPDGEYIPRVEQITAHAKPLRMEPKLWYRGLQFYYAEDAQLGCQRIDWMAKNGLNYIVYSPAPEDTDPESLVSVDPQTGQVWAPVKGVERYRKKWFDQKLLPDIRKRGLKLDMNHHNLLYWLPPGRYLADHPDYYSLICGKRAAKLSQLCVCTSNEDAVNTVIDNVRKYLRDNREVKVVGVIPEDGYGMCQCDKCVAQDDNPKDAFRKGKARNPSKSRRYAKLINAVANAILDEFPDVLVGGAAYVDLAWPPPDVELASNTTFWVALYWRDGCRPMAPSGTSKRNITFYDILEQWKNVYAGRLIVYEYYMGMHAQLSFPYPMAEVICEDWNHLKRLGIEGATVQCRSSCHHLYALSNLVFARCGWHDDVDFEEVLEEFLLGAYGSVAQEIRPIFDGFIRATRTFAQGTHDLLPNGTNVQYFLDEVGRNTIQRALRETREKAKSDRERRQVERLTAATRYWEMATDIYEAQSRAKRLEKTDPKAALSLRDGIINEQWPRLRKYLETKMPPGWMTISVPDNYEKRVIKPIREASAKLHKKLGQ